MQTRAHHGRKTAKHRASLFHSPPVVLCSGLGLQPSSTYLQTAAGKTMSRKRLKLPPFGRQPASKRSKDTKKRMNLFTVHILQHIFLKPRRKKTKSIKSSWVSAVLNHRIEHMCQPNHHSPLLWFTPFSRCSSIAFHCDETLDTYQRNSFAGSLAITKQIPTCEPAVEWSSEWSSKCPKIHKTHHWDRYILWVGTSLTAPQLDPKKRGPYAVRRVSDQGVLATICVVMDGPANRRNVSRFPQNFVAIQDYTYNYTYNWILPRNQIDKIKKGLRIEEPTEFSQKFIQKFMFKKLTSLGNSGLWEQLDPCAQEPHTALNRVGKAWATNLLGRPTHSGVFIASSHQKRCMILKKRSAESWKNTRLKNTN